LGVDSTLYIADEAGGLSAINPGGEILWQYSGEGQGLPLRGPVAAPDGSIYLLLEDAHGDVLLAFSSSGELLWSVKTGTSAAKSAPRLDPDGKTIFVKNQAFSTLDGSLVELHPPTEQDPVLKNRGQYFIGADAKNYFLAGHAVIQWEHGSAGFTVVQNAEWNYRSAGFTQYSTFPVDAGATPDGSIWIFYSAYYGGTMLVWVDPTGKLLGTSNTSLANNSLLIAADGQNTAVICGPGVQEGGDGSVRCYAYPQGSAEPLWEIVLQEQPANVIGGSLATGRFYITTQDGHFYAIGDPGSVITPTSPP
jgi:hypothetical protein